MNELPGLWCERCGLFAFFLTHNMHGAQVVRVCIARIKKQEREPEKSNLVAKFNK